jgi:hypothetical protein
MLWEFGANHLRRWTMPRSAVKPRNYVSPPVGLRSKPEEVRKPSVHTQNILGCHIFAWKWVHGDRQTEVEEGGLVRQDLNGLDPKA